MRRIVMSELTGTTGPVDTGVLINRLELADITERVDVNERADTTKMTDTTDQVERKSLTYTSL